jgi:hypothetical protein
MRLGDYDLAFLARLSQYFRLRAQEAATAGDYDAADIADEKRDLILAELRRQKPPPSRKKADDCVEMIRRQYAEWEREIQEFNAETDRGLAKLRQRQMRQREALELEWGTQQVERYRKPSGGLIQQRLLEMDMIHRNQIAIAKWIHGGVEMLEQREFIEAQNRFQTDFGDAEARLARDHRDEIERFKERRKRKKLFMMRRIEKKEQTLTNRLRVLHEKPPPLKSSKELAGDPPTVRTVVASGRAAVDPGRKLPMMALRRQPIAVRAQSAQGTGT